MGICSSSQTSSTSYPPAPEQEKALMNLASDDMMPNLFEKLGIDLSSSQTSINDDLKYQSLIANKINLESQLSKLQAELAKGSRYSSTTQGIETQIKGIQAQIARSERDINNRINTFKPEIKYKMRQMATPDVELIRERYGETSQEYKDAFKSYQDKIVEDFKIDQKSQDAFKKAALKYFEGDYSITDSQKKWVQDNLAPQREAINKIFNEAGGEGSLYNSINEYEQRIKQTGLDMGVALDALASQVRDTGKSMNEALENTIKVRDELMAQGIEDKTGELTKAAAMKAASLGRSPSDPEYQSEMKEMLAKEIKSGQLQLAAYESENKMRIAERTGSGLENVEQQRVGVVERTGAGLEDASMKRFGVAQQRAQAEMALAEKQSGMEYDLGTGVALRGITTGMNVGQYNEALQQQGVANAYQAYQTPFGLASSYYQGERLASPTTTTTSRGSLLSGITDFTSGVFNAYSGINQGQYYRDMGEYYRNYPYSIG